MGTVWIEIPVSESDESWIHIVSCKHQSEKSPNEGVLFEKILVNVTIPERAVNISEKGLSYVSENAGVVGNVYITLKNFSIPCDLLILKDYEFCECLDELTRQQLILTSCESHPQSDVIIIDFFVHKNIFKLFDLPRRYAQRRNNIRSKFRFFLSKLFPTEITAAVDDKIVHENFMSLMKNNTFYKSFNRILPSDVPRSVGLGLSVELYPYQQRTVAWMLRRENSDICRDKEFNFTFFKIPNVDEESLYFNNFTGDIALDPIIIKTQEPLGGILADDVGLGKTIEMLSLIISHPMKLLQNKKLPNENSCIRCRTRLVGKLYRMYKNVIKMGLQAQLLCSDCIRPNNIFKSRSTFIVVPNTLLNPWITEIEKKISDESFTYVLYEGIRKKYVHPISFMQYDVVITTYSVLLAEFYHSDLILSQEEKSLRHKRKYPSKISPLTYVEFWRVVFDESQNVENKSAKMAQMCCNIKSINRWCVTGTPIHRSLDDIEGLFSLFNYYPFNNHDSFKEIFYHDLSLKRLDNLVIVLQEIMHRTEKYQTTGEINMPRVEHISITLDFDPVELHYYLDYQHKNSVNTKKWKKKLKMISDHDKIDAKVHRNFIAPFNTLRHLCSDPFHLLPKKVRNNQDEAECVHSIEDAITKLIEKKRLECEEINRSLIMFRNGMAGLRILSKKIEDAKKIYLQTIEIWNTNSALIKTDRLQKIHVLQNILSISEYRDTVLKGELNDLINEYIKPSFTDMTDSRFELNKIMDNICNIDYLDPVSIVIDDILPRHIHSETLMRKITYTLSKEGITNSLFVRPFKYETLSSYIFSSLNIVKNLLNDIIIKISDLEVTNRKIVLKAAKNCCLSVERTLYGTPRTNQSIDKSCPFCGVEKAMNELEAHLYDQDFKNNILTSMTGFRGKKDIDIILKVILSEGELQNNRLIETWLNYVKKGFSALRAHFTNVRSWFTAQDEIQSCCRRLNLNDLKGRSDGVSDSLLVKHSLRDHRVNAHHFDKQLKVEIRQLKYFMNLSEFCSKKTTLNKELCPVCYEELGTEWIVLACSHFLCPFCYRKTLKIIEKEEFECPLCRIRSQNDEIFKVNTDKSKYSESKINFNFPTKIAQILNQVHIILSQTHDEKIIIFSQWDSVLDLCKIHLVDSGLEYSYITAASHVKTELQSFYDIPEKRILLMKLNLGSQGITITCANHIIFADVCLNRHDELQAIGRCHRIGQKKDIKVYHFVMKMSIEEKIFNNREVTESWFPTKSNKRFTPLQAKEFLKFTDEKCDL